MFKNFFLDFTYAKKVNHYLTSDDSLIPDSKVHVRKKIVILGANASGKTTFSKLLCAMNNFIIGRSVSQKGMNLYNAIYDTNKSANFEMEFAINRYAYRIYCEFNHNGIIREYLRKTKIYRSFNIAKIRQHLNESKNVLEYSNENIDPITNLDGFESKMLKNNDAATQNILKEFVNGEGFHYTFSHFADYMLSETKVNAPVEMLNKVLPVIDSSVDRVIELTSGDASVKTNSYLIIFKNGEHLTIPDGDLRRGQDRLSHGTYEGLAFLNFLQEIKHRKNDLIFLDEKLSHLHAELEVYLIMTAFYIKREAQTFFTSHNSSLLDLAIPSICFLFFGRDGEYNTATFASDKITKNDRSLRNYYENDFFNNIPDFSKLDDYFEETIYNV